MTDKTTVPDISVVIPCYNAERWVSRAIESVLAQEGVTVEVIAIDDGSTDGSTDVLRRYEDRIHWETGPNRGACAARNRGLALARADYVMFLDADDYVEGPFLRGLRDQLDASACDCAIGMVADASEDASPRLRAVPRTQSWKTLIIDWLHGKFVPPCGLMWRTAYVREIEGWNESLSKNQDGELVLRAASRQAEFCASRGGNGVYWHHASPERISQTKTPHKILDAFSVYVDLATTLKSHQALTQDVNSALSSATHGVERAAMKAGLVGTANEISCLRRSYGWNRYEGTTSHKVACYLIGLRAKEQIALHMADVRRSHGTSKV